MTHTIHAQATLLLRICAVPNAGHLQHSTSRHTHTHTLTSRFSYHFTHGSV